MASQLVLTVIQDNDVTVDLAVTQEDGVTPQNLTGLTPLMLVKFSRNAPDSPATVLGAGTGLTITSLTGGTLTALLSRTVLAQAGTFWWRLDVTDLTGNRTTAIYGPLVITPV